MIKKRERKRAFLILLSFVLIIVTAVVVIKYLQPYMPDREIPTTEQSKQIEQKEVEPTYINETCFDGSNEVAPVLYSIPFKKSDYYIMNKDLIKTISEKRTVAIMNRANEIVQTLFAIDGKEVARNPEKYTEKLDKIFLKDSYFVNESELHQNSEEYIANYLKTVADSKMQTEVTFETDKSLVYEDLEYYVRGLMRLKVYKLDQEEKENLKKIIPFELEENTTYTLVYEVGLGTGDLSRTPADMKVYSLKVVKILETKKSK